MTHKTYTVTKVTFSKKYKVVQFTYTNNDDAKDYFTTEFTPAPVHTIPLDSEENDAKNVDEAMEKFAEDFLAELLAAPEAEDPNHQL